MCRGKHTSPRQHSADELVWKLLESTTIPTAYVRLVTSFLYGRNFYGTVDNAVSATRIIRAGVPQWSCVSPILYAFYTNDRPTLEGRFQVGERGVELVLYSTHCSSAYSTHSHRADMNAGVTGSIAPVAWQVTCQDQRWHHNRLITTRSTSPKGLHYSSSTSSGGHVWPTSDALTHGRRRCYIYPFARHY